MELNDNGEGKCSVPMWMNGCPAGFCDAVAYGPPVPSARYRDSSGRTHRYDGRYDGYVPGLACHAHGGPEFRRHKGDPCIYCGIPHDDLEPGACPGKKEAEVKP